METFKDALKSKNMALLEKLVSSEADVNQADDGRDKFSPLHWACFYGNLEGTHLLLWHGSDVSAGSSRGWTPMHVVALRGTTKCAESLLNYDADVNSRDHRGCSPAHLAAIHGHSITLTTLIKHGGRCNERNENGWTPVHAACFHGRLGCLQVLYKCGGNLEEYDSLGNTPAHLAAGEGHVNCLQFLVANCRSIAELFSARNDHGETPLNLSELYYKTDASNYITRARDELVSPEKQSTYSYPGHVAAFNGDLDQLEAMLGSGAIGLEDVDDTHSSFAHKAACQGHAHILEFLLGAGADVAARNDRNETPADVALKFGREDCLRILSAQSTQSAGDVGTEDAGSERFANPLSRARVRIDELNKLLEIANKNYVQLGGVLGDSRREEQDREVEKYILSLSLKLEAERVKREKLEQKLDAYKREILTLQGKQGEHRSRSKPRPKIY